MLFKELKFIYENINILIINFIILHIATHDIYYIIIMYENYFLIDIYTLCNN